MENRKRRVAVTGMGLISCIGNTPEEAWASIEEKKCGIGPITGFDATGFRASLAGEVKDETIQSSFTDRQLKFNDRFTRFARTAARQAMEDSGFSAADPERFGVLIASGIGGLQTIEKNARTLNDRGPAKISPYFIPMSLINLAAGEVAIDTGAKGACEAIVTACAAGTNAIGEAFHRIRDGYEDAILAGGCEAPITPLGVSGFQSMRALHTGNDPENASIPFDENRSGFVMAEGAGMLMLEEYESAVKRGADILAEIVGYGTTCDAHHITAPDPEGKGAAQAMKKALQDADLLPEQIDYINAHGTSTGLNDRMESQAVLSVFGTETPAMSSTKSYTGHMLGASGAAESVFCIKALQHQMIPCTLNTKTIDPEIQARVVISNHIETSLDYVMNNSFGFGGHNASLIFRKAEENRKES